MCSTWSPINQRLSHCGSGGQPKEYGPGSIQHREQTIALTNPAVAQEVHHRHLRCRMVVKGPAVLLRRTQYHQGIRQRRSGHIKSSSKSHVHTSWTCAPGCAKHKGYPTENLKHSSRFSFRFGSDHLVRQESWCMTKREHSPVPS